LPKRKDKKEWLEIVWENKIICAGNVGDSLLATMH
jgi:hypothetical protein